MENIDSYIVEVWNKTNILEQIVEENVWDFCRMLEKDGFLVGDNAAISAISIGPFKIASMVDIKRKDMFVYLLETIMPAIFSEIRGLTFDEAYALYLLPATSLLINLADQCYWIKDLLQWEILIFIRKQNKNNIYPTIKDIKKSSVFRGFEDWQIDDAIKKLKDYGNMLGDKNSLLQIDFEGRMECLV